jgi:hypothetical protein
MSSVADISYFLSPGPNVADIDAAAKAMLFALELGATGPALLDKLRRLLVAFGDPAPEQALLPGEAAVVLLRHAARTGVMPAELVHPLRSVGYTAMHRLVRTLHGSLPLERLKRDSAHLYVVVLCLARLGDGAAIH